MVVGLLLTAVIAWAAWHRETRKPQRYFGEAWIIGGSVLLAAWWLSRPEPHPGQRIRCSELEALE